MRKTFTTVTEFKRVLAVGDKLSCVHHQKEIGRDENGKIVYGDMDMGDGVVVIKQTNQFAIQRGDKNPSYCQYPKASQASITDNTLTIFEPDYRQPVMAGSKPMLIPIPILTYKFVE